MPTGTPIAAFPEYAGEDGTQAYNGTDFANRSQGKQNFGGWPEAGATNLLLAKRGTS